METVAIRFVLFACLLVNVHTTNDINLSELAEIAKEASTNTSINVCDETNTNNSLLAAVNVHNLFQDSKYFVDMPLKFDPEVIQKEFDQRFGEYELQAINRSALQAFVDEYFEPAGNELEDCQLEGWEKYPPKLMKIQDSMLRDWALKLNAIWKLLCRKMKPNHNSKRTSLIQIPEEFIVPGGRFREFYYWDAYWIVKGLAASGLNNAIKKMITNFVTVVDKYGFIPNGGRIYYLGRSHPPLLIPMVYEYYELTRDLAFVNKILPTLIREYEFWQNNRILSNIEGTWLEIEDTWVIDVTDDRGNIFSVFYYHSKCNVPRPESFLADIMHASRLSAYERPKFYMDIASAAESGWDFSSRWFKDSHNIETIETTNIIPIDLNAFICWNLDILQYLLRNTGNPLKAKVFRDKREILRQAMLQVFYNDTEGAWFDYNLRTKSHNFDFYPSIVVPLFGECYQPLNLKMGVYNYPGGVPTSLIKDTKQQWDFPNGWSPTNHMIIEGMRKSSNPVVQEQAYRLAKKWVLSNFKVFRETGQMWEKYDVSGNASHPGGGGEYLVQDGFGWSNGVILDLLTTYYDRMRIEPGDLMPNNGGSATNNNTSAKGATSERMSFKSNISLMSIIISIFYTYLLMR